MKPHNGFHRLNSIVAFILLVFLVGSTHAGELPTLLDIYDGVENHLMFVTFSYDESGRNIGRTIYMSDSTFMREVKINYGSDGQRLNEVSYNFNGDTVFVTSYNNSATATNFSIVDQFKLDHVGGLVSYTNANPLEYNLVYASTSAAAANMKYEQDAQGNLTRVTITTPANEVYYGIFRSSVGVTRETAVVKNRSPQALVRARGASLIDVDFNLASAGEVRCELITLSGRQAAVLYRGRLDKGSHTRSIRINSKRRAVANGVYLFVVSVNGVAVSKSRYLHQKTMLGGVK